MRLEAAVNKLASGARSGKPVEAVLELDLREEEQEWKAYLHHAQTEAGHAELEEHLAAVRAKGVKP